MADYAGILVAQVKAHPLAGQSVNVTGGLDVPPTGFTQVLAPSATVAGAVEAVAASPGVVVDHAAVVAAAAPQLYWFEIVHYTPLRIDLGNLVATTTRPIEIYNAYRTAQRTLSSATNNAGTGIQFVGLPTLPSAIDPQEGQVFDVEVSTQGQPTIDGTLDFVVDTGAISIPITGSRIVLFPYEPETPIRELLEFKTDVLRSADGSEQRIAQRKNPRQAFELRILAEEGGARRRMVTLLKNWHARPFGVPIWWEARPLGADAVAGATTITVDTLYGDFRVGGQTILLQDDQVFDALDIASLTPTSITFSSPLTQNLDAGTTLVMPLRTAYAGGRIRGTRPPVNLQELRLVFSVVDNDADLGDTSAFLTYNGRVLLDEPNLMASNTVPDSFEVQLETIDNETGSPIQFTTWDISHPVTQKGFLGDSSRRIWEIRQLLHALRGSQKDFYLPTFAADFEVVESLTVGGFSMDIAAMGYTDHVDGQEPYRAIRIEETDGTLHYRQVVNSAEISATVERLTVDVAWSATIAPEDIERVSYLQLVRIADDRAVFDHLRPGMSRVLTNVTGVQ